jgi:hypothetical protein
LRGGERREKRKEGRKEGRRSLPNEAGYSRQAV